MTNILVQAEQIENRHASLGARRDDGGDRDAAMARYGADLLGRAIGHEQARDTRLGLPATMFYSNLIHQVIDHPTRKIMAFMAARDVQAGR
jgi:hypothetical protein